MQFFEKEIFVYACPCIDASERFQTGRRFPKNSRPKIPARKPNYTLPLSLCPAAKRHGIRIKEMCLTVNNILGYSIDSCRDYMNQTLLIFERGQTDCHSGLSCLGSLFSFQGVCLTAATPLLVSRKCLLEPQATAMGTCSFSKKKYLYTLVPA